MDRSKAAFPNKV